ncbi:MAG TPA: hypothetical protein DCX19_00640 [Alphaproteobacteria bacterium]|nr:hypothetical protein [Alphaproteobacteria bacterium]
MGADFDWTDVRFVARMLEKDYPDTDLIALSDDELREMMAAVAKSDAVPADSVYALAVKSAWSVLQNGADDSRDAPDAAV